VVPPGTNGCGNSCVNSPEDGPVGPQPLVPGGTTRNEWLWEQLCEFS